MLDTRGALAKPQLQKVGVTWTGGGAGRCPAGVITGMLLCLTLTLPLYLLRFIRGGSEQQLLALQPTRGAATHTGYAHKKLVERALEARAFRRMYLDGTTVAKGCLCVEKDKDNRHNLQMSRWCRIRSCFARARQTSSGTSPKWRLSRGLGKFKSDADIKARSTCRLITNKMDFNIPADCKDVVVLISCGSFSPPTIAHLRILEDARDSLERSGIHVAGGFLSPVHKAYGKPSLIEMYHRVNMVSEALKDSEWLSVDTWECCQNSWTATERVISRFQDELNRLHREGKLTRPARPALIGGADLVLSFAAKNEKGHDLWSSTDVQSLVSKGIVAIVRKGSDLKRFIASTPVFAENLEKIHVVEPPVENDISSTAVRDILQRGDSIKYVVHEAVLRYINYHKLSQRPEWQRRKAALARRGSVHLCHRLSDLE
eukprot:gnl/TRDRNA2_/TRDRNA2_171579_c0_seq1.p1 gnl/TRDRNA2_/TRDRNA2_171579_c0~~gnl/TRDRNA2_/TRDRNA2_171579_c0_seq1.p1  ORF type:complete len:472 (+),score=55.75 gnl/TRDRNA2_/TRDRNA2_171579_c0_seq1:127-1416(+)